MRIQRFISIMLLLTILLTLIPMLPAQAQETDIELTETIATTSGHFTVHYPAGWFASNDALLDIQQKFDSEGLVISDDEAVLNNPLEGTRSNTLIFALYPTLDIYRSNPNPPPDIFGKVVNQVFQGLNGVEEFEVAGFPAARAILGNGGLAIIGLGPAIMVVSFSSRDEASLSTLYTIIDSMEFHEPEAEHLLSPDSVTRSLTTADKRVTFQSGENWYTGSAGNILYTAPSAAAIQSLLFNFLDTGALDNVLFIAMPVSYADYFEPDHIPTETDIRMILERTMVRRFNTVPRGDFEDLTLPGFDGTAYQLIGETGSDNLSTFVAADIGQVIYLFAAFYPVDLAEGLQPLIDTLFDSISVEALSPEIASLPPEGNRPGFRAPGFSSTFADGESMVMADTVNQGEIIMLNFWATWCAPCRTEMPAIQKAYRDYADDGFMVLAINNQETLPVIHAFLDDLRLDIPVVLDYTGTIQQLYGIMSYPTSIFIDASGVIYNVHMGPLDYDEIVSLIEEGKTRE